MELQKIQIKIENQVNERDEINKESEKKSEETRGVVNDENEDNEQNNEFGIKLGNNLIEETRTEKE